MGGPWAAVRALGHPWQRNAVEWTLLSYVTGALGGTSVFGTRSVLGGGPARLLSAQPGWLGADREKVASARPEAANVDERHDQQRVGSLLALIRSRGHLVARIDPLGRCLGPWKSWQCDGTGEWHEPLLAALVHGYKCDAPASEKASFLHTLLRLRRPITAQRTFFDDAAQDVALSSTVSGEGRPLPSLIEDLLPRYCGPLAFEYEHLPSWPQQAWLRGRIEGPWPCLSAADRRDLLLDLCKADTTERFLAAKFPSSKRFGLEGCEAIVPALRALCRRASSHGVHRIEVGMSHRGRLNVLHNLLDKPLGALCSEMEGQQSEFRVGDVKYHLGQTVTLTMSGGRDLTVTVAPNPSHLEFCQPVVLGLVRALQRHGGGDAGGVLALLVHGDASLAGLGIAAETFQLASLQGYTVGGAIHVVINNTVGFTTLPEEGRTAQHATDVAKAAGAPVIHANADDPEALVRAFHLAADWRARWRADIVVDVCGYRRNGHNEQDDPSMTLPMTYRAISSHPGVVARYARRLEEEGAISEGETVKWAETLWAEYEGEHERARRGEYKEAALEFLTSHWQAAALRSLAGKEPGFKESVGQYQTGLPLETLQLVARGLAEAPAGMALHPETARLLARRRGMAAGPDARVDFAFAELLAFGTLSLHRPEEEDKGMEAAAQRAALGLNYSHFGVRLSGQDSERGTFNQRHAVVYDMATRRRAVAVGNIDHAQDLIEVVNSPLSEAAVLAFEYGHSVASQRRALVLWEAQFGDFANNAQVVIDQFVSSGQAKWGQESGLVLLLPHGYDGQGPDHSSARLERYLALVNDDPDHLPGYAPTHRALIGETYAALAAELRTGDLRRDHVEAILRRLGALQGGRDHAEVMNVLWAELGLPPGEELRKDVWEAFMVQFIRRQSERDANMFVVVPSTPAQYFHVLRRQANLPYQRPLVVLTPKYLHHHRPATSALADFTTGQFFNRVIDDGKESDNTRHRARDAEGRPYLRPPAEIARVLLCAGQLYYHLSAARRARRIADIVLVRLEQIAPFPHDIVLRVLRQYPNAGVCWCQEEPKNQGAWNYVRPRLVTALREDVKAGGAGGTESGRAVRYIGRPASATTATAAYAIHAHEQAAIIDESLTL